MISNIDHCSCCINRFVRETKMIRVLPHRPCTVLIAHRVSNYECNFIKFRECISKLDCMRPIQELILTGSHPKPHPSHKFILEKLMRYTFKFSRKTTYKIATQPFFHQAIFGQYFIQLVTIHLKALILSGTVIFHQTIG